MEFKVSFSSALVALCFTACATNLQNDSPKELPEAPEDSLTYFDPALLKPIQTRQVGTEILEISELSEIERRWYPKHWIVAEEPSYWQLSNDRRYSEEQFVRLTVLPTFSAPLIYTIRIRGDGSGIWTFKQTNGKGGYGAGDKYWSSQKRASRRENFLILKQLKGIGAHDQPFNCWPDPNTVMLDGTQIVFEFSQHGQYEFTRCGLISGDFSSKLNSVFTDVFRDLDSIR